MKRRSLPATEVKNRFGRVLREVSRSGGPLLIERDGRPVAVLLSVGAFERLERRRRRLSGEEAALLKDTFGMWSRRRDLDEDWLATGRSRWASQWQDDRR